VNVRDKMNQELEEQFQVQPVSKIAGNIELTFNTKDKNLDHYELISDQIVLTIGKSGRANRLTFNDLDSGSLFETAETIKKIARKVKEIEEFEEVDKDQDFDIDIIEDGEPQQDKIKTKVIGVIEDLESNGNTSEVSLEEIFSELQDYRDGLIIECIKKLKKDGEIFELPNEEPTKFQRM